MYVYLGVAANSAALNGMARSDEIIDLWKNYIAGHYKISDKRFVVCDIGSTIYE
jgi:hypothetical protein